MVTSGKKAEGKCNTGVGELKLQAIRCKINDKDILYCTGNIANIL